MSVVEIDLAPGADRVAVVTVNDPERRNALTPPMIDALVAAFDQLESDGGIGAVVITGAPPAFCAGADLSHLGASPSEAGLRGIYEGFLRVGRSPLPTIAAVNGAAVGAGMNLALCCDLRLAGRRAKFDTRFLQLGLHPGGGHTWMMRRIMGPEATAAAVLFGEVLDGAEAERAGLVWRCVDDDGLLPAALEMAAAARPRQADQGHHRRDGRCRLPRRRRDRRARSAGVVDGPAGVRRPPRRDTRQDQLPLI